MLKRMELVLAWSSRKIIIWSRLTSLKEIKAKIIERFPEIEFLDISHVDDLTLSFTNKLQKDYHFNVVVSKYCESVHICAILNDKPSHLYFWCNEIDFYGDVKVNINKLLQFVFTNIEILKNHKTRIVQKIQWFSQRFTLEYYQDGWKELSHRNGLKYSDLEFPKISSKQHIYEWR